MGLQGVEGGDKLSAWKQETVENETTHRSVGMPVGIGSKHPPFSLVNFGSRSSFSSQLSRSKSSHTRVGVPNCKRREQEDNGHSEFKLFKRRRRYQ